jgi:hypothetical protein
MSWYGRFILFFLGWLIDIGFLPNNEATHNDPADTSELYTGD